MNLKKYLAGAVLAAGAMVASSAFAGFANFDGQNQTPLSYSEGGITFTSLFPDHVHVGDIFQNAIYNHNGGCCTNPTEITQTGGGAFSLLSLDVLDTQSVTRFIGSNGNIWTVAGIGTINFGNFFANVTSVVWDNDFNGSSAIDNVATGVSAVPEPETYAMMLAGLGLLGFAARRKKAQEAAAA